MLNYDKSPIMNFLDFEKPIADLENKIAELRHLSDSDELNISDEINRLQVKVDRLLKNTYSKLSAWQKTAVARHPDRPHSSHYIQRLFDDFIPLAGDRLFGEDLAILGGMGRLKGRTVMVLGQEKGHDTETRLRHNFGMAKPEGYRKTRRLMEMADHFAIPVICFVDTAGAFPGIEAEARGQAEAIARSIETCLKIRVPLLSVIIGEGGSGGAIALAAANQIIMLEHSIYSVISPEACSSILWRNSASTQDAAEALRLTAQDLEKLHVIDKIIAEPIGGGHRNGEIVIDQVGDVLYQTLTLYDRFSGDDIRDKRREKFLAMGKIGL
jgi:acetyl-CoA carboxylase carboxyl transferase subunit alpha